MTALIPFAVLSGDRIAGTDPSRPPFVQPQPVLNAVSGGPEAEPAEAPDAPWLFAARQVPQPLVPPYRMVTPFRWIENGNGVAAILDRHGRSVTFIRSCEAEGYVTWRNRQGW